MRPEERLFAAIGQVDEAMLEQSEKGGHRRGHLRAALIAAVCAALLLSGAFAGRKILRIFAEQNEGIAKEYWADGYVSNADKGGNGEIDHTLIVRDDYGLQAVLSLENGVNAWIVSLTPSQQAQRATEATLWHGTAEFTALDPDEFTRIEGNQKSPGGWSSGFHGISLPFGLDGQPGQFVSIEIVELPDAVSSLDLGICCDSGPYDSILNANQGDLVIFELPDDMERYDIVAATWDTELPAEKAGNAILRIGVTSENPIAE